MVEKARENSKYLYIMLGLFIVLTVYVNIVKKPPLLYCTIIRFFIGLMPVLMCSKAYWEKRDTQSLFLTLGVIFCLISDTIINLSFVSGVMGFMCAHLCFIKAFHSVQKPDRKSWILYAVLTVAALAVIFAFSVVSYRVRNVAIPISIYALVLFMMFISALPQKKLLKTGGILFVLSDCMLGLRLALRIKEGWVSSIVLFVYFLALAYISLGCLEEKDI